MAFPRSQETVITVVQRSVPAVATAFHRSRATVVTVLRRPVPAVITAFHRSRATVTTVLRWPVPAVTTVFPGTGPAVATLLRRLSPMDTTVLRRIGPTGVVVLRRPGLAALTAATVLRRLVLTAGTGFYGLGPSVTAPTAGTGFCRALSTFMEVASAVRRTLTAPVVSVFRAAVPTMGELHQVVVSLYPPVSRLVHVVRGRPDDMDETVSRLVHVVRVFPWRWWYVGRTYGL